MTFGDRIKKLRLSKNWTMKELGSKLSLAESTISGYELGNRNPEFEILIKISELFETSIDYLLKGELNEEIDSFGIRIRKLRINRGWTLDYFADALYVTAQVISNYERDYREPEFSTLVEIAKIFKVTTDFLLGYEVEK